MHRLRLPAVLFAVVLAASALIVVGPAAAVLPPSVDTDGDGSMDTVESNLGSDPGNPASSPESVAVPASCMDTLDNDLDAAIDEADGGCQPPKVSKKVFPAAGSDQFDSTIALDDYALATPMGTCPLDFEGSGPTVVTRSAPADLGGGLRTIQTEMVALQLSGLGTLLPGSPCNPGGTPISFPATIIEDPAMPSTGEVSDTNADPAKDFPADSSFEVFFLVDTPLGLLPGGPPGGPMGDPVLVTNTIRSLPPYHSPANPSLNPDCYTVAGLPHQHCPKPPLDHFKCYTGEFPPFQSRVVTLQDQFGTVRSRVATPNRFCNPVSKNDQRIFDPGGHLKRYKLRAVQGEPPFVPLEVTVLNQFGEQDLSVLKPIALFVPSQKNRLSKPLALDHFKCYSVSGLPVNQKVTLEDQFDVQDGRVEKATVLEPKTLCAPVTKTVGQVVTPVGDPAWHLVCYAIETRKFAPRRIVVRNQFGRERVLVTKPVELCVPSMKFLPQPPPPEIEIDNYNSQAVLQLSSGPAAEMVEVAGPTTFEVGLPSLADPDNDGLEQVPIEIVAMSLSGVSQLFGNATVTFRTASESPFQAPVGEIEENNNATPGVLDVPPFAPSGTATSVFHVAFEVTFTMQNQTLTLHACTPMILSATITHKPFAQGDTFRTEQIVQLCDGNGQQQQVQLGPVTFIPAP